MNVKELTKKLQEKGDKISKATKVRSLLQKQKGLWKDKQSLTDFKEPVLDLHRRNGKIDTYESATAGKFVFEHSNGKSRFIELRPSDQETRDYGDRKIRWYTAHEDRPYAGWDNPIVDGESVMLGYEKTKATDLKYQQAIERLKNQGKMTWVWIIIGIAVAIAIVGFAYMNWIQPALANKKAVDNSVPQGQTNPPLAGLILLGIGNAKRLKRGLLTRRRENYRNTKDINSYCNII